MDNVTIAKIPTREDAAVGLRMIHSFLNAARPVWTVDPPKYPGYYWHRESSNARPYVVEVREDYSEVPVPLVVQEWRPENTGVQYLRDYAGGHWAGPLETPEER